MAAAGRSKSLTTGKVRCGVAAVHEVLGSIALETPVNCHSELMKSGISFQLVAADINDTNKSVARKTLQFANDAKIYRTVNSPKLFESIQIDLIHLVSLLNDKCFQSVRLYIYRVR